MTPIDPAVALTLPMIEAAHRRIADRIRRTPMLTSGVLDGEAQAQLFFKAENFQCVGAFKARGAANAVLSLSDHDARLGVVTHSSGNHAAALARAARLRGVPAYIVMPENAPRSKRASVLRYGGKVVDCAPNLAAREAEAARVEAETGAVFIPPYNDLAVMAGQGTVAVEMLQDVPGLDLILCPVGGGGLLSGVAVAAKGIRPQIEVVAVEPSGADDAFRSMEAGHIIPAENPQTVADGLRTSLGDKTFPVIQRHVDRIVTVSDELIIQAMRTVWEVLKVVIEPSAAVAYAAVLAAQVDVRGRRVGIILTGGNLDLDSLPWSRPGH